ncbi:MAG: disulfide bond formation protein B [Moraxellaceae bacterium]|nr:disulfide bond formation protein B [Moraxellaceae bacterium]MBP8853125.1 disulfide bond formation protein B [Moraxellaceae bacterium]MBP9045744.1 disulfide bond formation protein B [Moraxellaceae bacterium]MBP9731123.1 disulfide bond formation protein B [Moraxellaceae bacterium]MCC6200075.1 disulfide bond formation protein B [Moraxellaceae bacterium]
MPFIPSPRLTNLGILLLTIAAMGFALWLQYYQQLEPCPLCIFQRMAMMATSAVVLLAFLHGPARVGRRVYAGFTLLTSLAGVAVAGRHVWLQNLPPDQVPSCGPGLDYWLDTFPLFEVIGKVLRGSGECAAIEGAFMGITLPGWTLVVFVGLAALAVWQLLRRD